MSDTLWDEGCVACGRYLHDECEQQPCCCSHGTTSNNTTSIISLEPNPYENAKVYKDDTSLKDPLSTGRKRAAKEYPINQESPCDWQGFKQCGGGLHPITGCQDGVQTDRHHGPIKIDRDAKVIDNSPGNVHCICKTCHNRWHYVNDGFYDREVYSKLLHNPVAATPEEIALNEAKWAAGAFRHLTSQRVSRFRKVESED